MSNNGMDRETKNLSDASREVKCRELACMDWANLPSARIQERLGPISWLTISNYRDTEEYKETITELRAEWLDQMRKLPQTAELRKKISQAMALGVDTIIDILSGKAAVKDKISAARLAAQLDGRFLRDGDDVDGKSKVNDDSVAQRLLEAMKRQDMVN